MGKLEFGISLKLLSEKFSAGLNKVRGQLNKFKSSISGSFSTKGINDFNKSVNNLGSSFSTQMKKVSSSMDGINAKISGLGKAIAGAFAVDKLIDFGKSIINVGASFQDQMARVQAVSNATKEEFEEMRKEAERLGDTTRYSATEAAQALESLVRNGLKAKDATKALSGVLQLAGSQAIELSEAADIATAAMNGFGKEVTDLNRINDILAATCSNSATNVKELAEGLKVAAPIAKVLNISMEEVCAALGTFANVGIKGSQAGTALRIMLNRLVAVTPKGAEALKKYGLSISEADVKGQNFTKTLEKLAKANMSLADLKAIFGEEASSAAAALTGNYSGYTKTKTTVENSQGEAARQFETGQGEFNKALKELKSAFEGLLRQFFQSNDSLFASLVKGVQHIVEELKKTSTLVMGLIAAIGIGFGRLVKKIRDGVKQDIAATKAEFSTDVFASIAVKQEFPKNKRNGDQELEYLEATRQAVEAYIREMQRLYQVVNSENKKILEAPIASAQRYNENIQRRIELLKRYKEIQARLAEHQSKEVKEPKMWSDTSNTKGWGDTLQDIGEAGETMGDLAEKFGKANKNIEDNSKEVEKNGKNWSTWAKIGGKALKWLGRFANSEWGKKAKNAAKAATGDENTFFNKDKFDKALKDRQEWVAKNEEILQDIKDLEHDIMKEVGKGKSFATDAHKYSGKSFEELLNLDPDELNAKLKQSIDDIKKANSLSNQLKSSITGFWNFTKKIGSSILSLFGGWIGVITTLAGIAYKHLKDSYDEYHRVFKEIKEDQKEVISKYATMESKVISLVNIMKDHNTETIAYKSALDALKTAFPDLVKNLDLERELVNLNAAEYEKLRDRIKEVIAVQREYELNEHKRKSVQSLQEDYDKKTKKYDDTLTKLFTKGSTKDQNGKDIPIIKEAATILSAQLKSDINTALLDKDTTQEDITKLILNALNRNNVKSKYSNEVNAGMLSKAYFDNYQRYGKAMDSVNSLTGYEAYPDKYINELVNIALEKFERDAEDLRKTGKAKGETDEQINSAIDSARQSILDSLIESLKNTNYKVDGKDALTYAKDNKLFEALLKPLVVGKNGKLTTTTTTTTETTITGSGDSKTPKQIFDETKKYIDALKDAGIIKEKEYRERLLSAYDSYISGLESLKKTDDESLELIKTLNKERDKLKDQIRAAADAEENMKKINEELAEKRKKELEEDQERGKEASKIEKAGLKAKSRYDNYPIYNELNGVFASDLLEGSVLAPLEHDLQRLYDYLDDLKSIHSLEEINDQLEQIEKLEGDGVEALRGQLNRLKLEIENAELAASDLDEKIQFRRAKKEIQDMTDEVGLMGYETVKGVFTTYDSLIRNLNEIGEKWDEMDFGEQMIQGIFGTIDAMISLAQMIKGLQEAWELLTFKKKALETAEAVSAQAGAAAVVAAEAEKTAAITGAVAAQTTAVLAAKTAQTKAATIAMAAESTAAYAGIPFAGVGLAAAQIAEMEALIAAAAALPMFAEGGIVGGTKYTGDQNLARVNSGEMIINRGQQKKLWDAISGGKYGSNNSLSGDVEFKISGQVLRGVLNNHDKKMSKIKS